MNTVVGKLLDTDRQARQLLDDARQYYEATIDEIGCEKERIREKYREKVDRHLGDVTQKEAEAAKEAMAVILAENERKLRVIEETFARNRAAWEDEIFARCVKRVDE